MIFKGTVQGEAARRFLDYHYRKPVPASPIRSIFDLDPDRVYPDREYPRYTGINLVPIKTVDLADYELHTATERGSFHATAKFFMVPNLLAAANEPRLVLEFAFSPELLLAGESLEDFALREVFGRK